MPATDAGRSRTAHAASCSDVARRVAAMDGRCNVPDLKPASDQVFEHFYFAIQAALEGLGVVMGPLALIREELRAGQLLAPINEPASRTRGYFVYALEASSDSPAVAVLRKWLVAAGSLTEIEFATYLSANCS